ncbi:MAG: hypothetical protein ACKOV8_02225 [Phycisphaerales bacterium]
MTIRRLQLVTTGTLVAAGLAAAAEAQSLSERINAVTEQRAAQQNLSKSGLLRALISTGVSVRFSETPAKEAFAYLKQLTGVDMTVRWSSDPGASDGFDPEAPITLEVNNGQALVVLERMIEQASTEPSTWQLRDGYVEVGPKSRLSVRSAQETRIYPIRDLLFEAPNFDNAPDFNLNQAMQSGGGMGGGGGGGTPFGESGEQPERRSAQEKAEELIDLIKSLVEPDAWLDESVASIRYYDGSIIVRAPDFIQRQIGGYGMLPPAPPSAGGGKGGRYVGLNLNLGFQQLQGFTPATVSGAAGGGGTGNFIPAGAEAPATGAPASGAPGTPPAPPAGGQGGTGRKGAPPAGAPSGGSSK